MFPGVVPKCLQGSPQFVFRGFFNVFLWISAAYFGVISNKVLGPMSIEDTYQISGVVPTISWGCMQHFL